MISRNVDVTGDLNSNMSKVVTFFFIKYFESRWFVVEMYFNFIYHRNVSLKLFIMETYF